MRSRYVVAVLIAALIALGTYALDGQACDAQATPIVCENQLTGNPPSEWDINGAGDSNLQGFATEISVNKGETVHFKVDTTASTFLIDIYRLGYYNGRGARKMATLASLAGRTQVDCLTVPATGLIDCGNWLESAAWSVPPTAVSGIYLARLTRPDTGGASHIVFIVRDDAAPADLLFQTSDTTWQAYNTYGGNSLYVGGPGTNPGRAYKVSYNRPFTTRGASPEDWLFNAEYPMVRWLEANGYNLSYTTGVDTDRTGATGLLRARAFLSVGHDEYWSGPQRTHVENARAAGVHLAFFSGNEVFWKTRWEASIDGTATPYRTLVSYKETHANAKIDPLPGIWTGTWRDPRFSPPADGGRPENALTGTLFTVNCCTTSAAIKVPQTFATQPFWRNTRVATLAPGATATLSAGTLGYEWDENANNGVRPPGLVVLSSTTLSASQTLQDYGSTYGAGTATHALTLYRHTSGALVFGAGTVQWSWGLDGIHDRGGSTPDLAMQQATVNLFADMGVPPHSLRSGLVPGTPPNDTSAPTSVITAPSTGASVQSGRSTAINGTSADTGGGLVTSVQVSTDGGVTWQTAAGTTSWTYAWTPGTPGSVAIKSRAIDGSGNLETPAAGVTVTITAPSCPCTLWNASASPSRIETSDTSASELGMRFHADVSGTISGIRFYKGAGNTGTHVGNLWTNTGTLLASATFMNEAATGWQQVTFSAPVAIAAQTTYVASYHTNTGQYAVDNGYFADGGVDSAPLHAPISSQGAGNGAYRYSASSAFPTETYQAANYWVDVVFTPDGGSDTAAPSVAISSPPGGATVSGVTVAVNATASDNVGVTGVQFKLDGANLGAEDTSSPYAVSWDTTPATSGSHVLAAVARDGAGNMATSAAITVTVQNLDTSAPSVAITAPGNGSTVSGSVSITATAADNIGVAGVQFKLDGTNLGAEVTASPYALTWNTNAGSNGTHTLSAVARDSAGNTSPSAVITLTVSNVAAGAVSIDAVAHGDRSPSATTIASGVFSTTSGNELLLAFVAADDLNAGQTVRSVSGGGLVWQLVVRTNAQRGTAEIWRAFSGTTLNNVSVTATLAQRAAASITIVTFTGVDASGTNGSGAIGAIASASATAGAPTASLVTRRNGSWAIGVGNDWTAATARTVGSGQTLVHQYLATVGDTFWVQRTNGPTLAAGTTVTINDTAPAGNRYNLSLCEILPAGGPADTSPPSLSIAAPLDASTVSGTVTVAATASDDNGVAGVQFRLDGLNLGTEIAAAPFSLDWNTTLTSNASHTLTAVARDAAGNTTTSPLVTVTVANTASAGLAIDATAFGDRSTTGATIATAAFSTRTADELLLAFVAADDVTAGNTVSGVTGGGLTWQLVVRTNARRGTSEIWRAVAPAALTNVVVSATLTQPAAASITVVSFTGADTSGSNGSAAIGATRSASASSGAPAGSLVTTRSNSWVLGVGNDWDAAIARTLGPGQTKVHEYLASVGDTFWVQRTAATTTVAGTTVTLNDSAPTADQYNFSLCEVLPR